MDLELKDKVVVISGAAGIKGSIGETMLGHLVNEGAIPAIIDRNDRGFEYVEEIQKKGIDATFCKTDVTDPDQIENAVNTIAKKYGRIDVVINNVGVNDGVGLNASYEDFMWSLKLNMVSYFLVVKHALPYLKSSKGKDHEKQYEVELFIDGKSKATATGTSKKKAEELAASKLYQDLINT